MFPHFDQSEYAAALKNAYRQFPAKDSTLDIDFVNNRQRVAGIYGAALDGVTFTRSTTGTYFDATGTMQTAAINEPRFEYDPVSLRPLGFLIEGSRANILLNSDIGATQSVTVSATAYTISFWGTGSVSLSGASTAGPLNGTGANNRVSLTFTPTAGTLTLTVSGTVTKWQLETGSFTSSYISTAGTAVTRGADVPSMTGASFSSWYNQSQGTFLAIFRERVGINTIGVTYRHVFLASGTADATSRISILVNNMDNISSEIYTSAAAEANFTGQTNTGQTRACVAYDTNDSAFTDNSAPPSFDNSVTTPTLTQIQFGKSFNSNVNGYLFGHIERIIYYPKRLSNNLLQYLTRLTA